MGWSKKQLDAAKVENAKKRAEFAEKDRWGRYGRPIEDGTYPAEVIDTGKTTGGYDTLVVRVDAPEKQAPEGKVKIDHRLTADWKAAEVYELWPDAFDEQADGSMALNENVKGRPCRAVVFHEPGMNPDDEPRAAIRRLLAPTGGNATQAREDVAAKPQAKAPPKKVKAEVADEDEDNLPF